MKAKRIMPLLLSAIMMVGTATAVPFTASAVETNAPVVSAQSAKTCLATPKISKAESINGGVKISWSKVKGAEKYRVYYKGSKGWTRLADTTSTAYTDSKVSSGKTYTYTVRCINSSATKFTSGYDSKGKTVKYISAPKITKAESVNGGVKISWNKSNGAEKYRVYYKGSKGWTRLADTTSTSYTDSKVSSGKTYTYTVRCINSSATKFTSGYDSKGKSVKYISAPKITKAESVNDGVKLTWSKVKGAEKYRVYYKGSKGWTRLADTTSTSYTDSKVSSGKTYTYTVRCINSSATKFTSGYDSKGKSVKYISAQKPKEKVWVVDYKTVHHEGYWKVVDTHEEPVYGWVGYNVCNDCGMKMKDADQEEEHLTWEMDHGGRGSYHHEKEYVQTGTKTVEDKKWVEPWDEKVVVGGHYEYR
jgi:fibronectin type 3 domain-containing protein